MLLTGALTPRPRRAAWQVDDRSWQLLHERGFPVVLDRAFPLRQSYLAGSGTAYRDAHGTRDTPNRVFDVQKHWWGATIIQHGFRCAPPCPGREAVLQGARPVDMAERPCLPPLHRALYFDADAVVIKNPLRLFDPQFDVQALSDWSGPQLPPLGATLGQSCGLYSMVKDDRVSTGEGSSRQAAHSGQPRQPARGQAKQPHARRCAGSMLREWWNFWWLGGGDSAVNAPNPCASTGVWTLEPTPAAIAFMAALRDRLLAPPTRHQ